MKVVTSGCPYIDIDAYAGCVAYAELLRLQGHDAIAASSAVLNESITSTIKTWDVPFSADYESGTEDTYVLIDISEPEFFDKMVDIDRVEEIIDHHPGFEQFWQEKIGDKAQIEFIGAACTLVFERWKRAGLLNRMPAEIAGLLMSGILDNTLNFKASVSTDRDGRAYDELSKIAHLPDDWPAQYFGECQDSILADLSTALANDTKTIMFKSLSENPVAVGQLVVWDASEVIAKHLPIIREVMAAKQPEWFVNVVSISEGKSYFVSDDDDIKTWVNNLLSANFEESVAIADRLWLRKEIIKQDIG